MNSGNLSQEEIEALLKEAENVPSDVEKTVTESDEPPTEDVHANKKTTQAVTESTGHPSIKVADFKEFDMEPLSKQPIADMGVLMDIPLSISVELGKSKCYVKDLLNLTVGSIVELDRLAGDPVDILVNGRAFAKGEVVVIDENFGVRIQEVLSKN